MKLLVRLMAFCALLCLVRCQSYAQTSGTLTPIPHPTFFNSSGQVASLGFLCTTQTGTTTSLATYQDAGLTTANQNPIRLNAVGRAVNGSNEVSIFLQGQKYRFTLYGPGTGNTCNGTTVGTLIWQADNVYDLAMFNTLLNTSIDTCIASQITGTSPNDASGKINGCIALLPASGGTVDARGLSGAQTISTTVTIPANVTVLLGTSTLTCTVGSGVLPCWNLTGNAARLIGMGSGNDSSGVDPGLSAALGSTSLVCSTCGATVDMIRVAIPSASRISLNTSLLYSPEVFGVWINMGGSGRRPLYITSAIYGRFRDIQAYNLVENGLELEGDLASPNNIATSYFNRLEQIVMQPKASNTTGAACHLNAINGEVSRTIIFGIRCSGNITTGGGLNEFLAETGSGATDSINHTTISNSYFGNPSSVGGEYGVHLKAGGTYSSQTGGVIEDFSITDTLVERLFAAATGTAIGGTDASNNRSGTGMGSIVMASIGVGANWATTIDRVNLGQTYTELAGFTNPGGGQATIRVDGTQFGNNSVGIVHTGSMVAGANTDSLFAQLANPSVNANGKTGVVTYGQAVTWGTYTAGGGSVATAYSGYFSAPTFATTNYALFVPNGQSRFNGFLGLSEDPAGIGLRVGVAAIGNNSAQARFDGSVTANGASQSISGVYVVPGFNTGGSAITSAYGITANPGAIGGGGSTAVGAGVEASATTGATKNYAFYGDSGRSLFDSVQVGLDVADAGSGVFKDGSGMKHIRAAGCTTAGAANAVCTATINWTTAFFDTNYSVVCHLDGITGKPIFNGVTTRNTGSVVVQIETSDGNAAGGTVDCIAMHDGG